jgi:hypothetical protein
MKTDRELLELAAKAVGYRWDEHGFYGDGNWWTGIEYLERWNPLTDDGDALRLAVALRMDLNINDEECDAFHPDGCVSEVGGESTGQVVRRAIVRAAAQIGDGM